MQGFFNTKKQLECRINGHMRISTLTGYSYTLL